MRHPLEGVLPAAFPAAKGPRRRAAQWWWDRGFHAFPVCSPVEPGDDSRCNAAGHGAHPQGRDSDGKPRHKVGKTPVTAWQERPDEDERAAQWSKWFDERSSNIAVAMGFAGAAYTIALDFDGPRGAASRDELERTLGRLPPTLEVITGRGRHLWFSAPPDSTPDDLAALIGAATSLSLVDGQLVARSKAATGFDIRGQGGYVVAPGSTHYSGAAYQAVGHPLSPMPSGWFAALPRRRPAAAAQPLLAAPQASDRKRFEGVLARELDDVRRAPEGERNDTLYFRAQKGLRQALAVDYDRDAVAAQFEDAARTAGLPLEEIRRTLASAESAARTAGPLALADRPRRDPDVVILNEPVDGLCRSVDEQWDEAVAVFDAAGLTVDEPPPVDESPPVDEPPPIIAVGPDLHRVVDAAIAALPRCPEIYQRAGLGLVRVLCEEHTPTLEPVARALLASLLSRAAQWTLQTRRGAKAVAPPGDVVAAVHATRVYPAAVRVLRGITAAPMLRRDGTIATAHGYDRATRLFVHWPDAPIAVPDAPTRDDAARAYATLRSLFDDFDFATNNSDTAKAAIVAALLTPLAREAVDGPVPAFVFGADRPNAGKTLAATVCGTITLGRAPAIRQHTDEDDETAKRLTAIAIAGHPIALFDNVRVALQGSALEAVLTAPDTIAGRILGQSADREFAWRTTLYLTANNAEIGNDNARRCIYIALRGRGDTRDDDEQRWRIPNLREHVLQQRRALLTAAHTLLRAHVVAGRPCDVRALDSFEQWSRVVAAAVHWASGHNPIAASVPAESRRDEAAARAVVLSWAAVFGTAPQRVGRALDVVRAAADRDSAAGALRDALFALVDGDDRRGSSTRAIGKAVALLVGRTYLDPSGAALTLVAATPEHGSARYAIHGLLAAADTSSKSRHPS